MVMSGVNLTTKQLMVMSGWSIKLTTLFFWAGLDLQSTDVNIKMNTHAYLDYDDLL